MDISLKPLIVFSSKPVNYPPFRFDVGDGADVIFGGEDKLVVEHPLRLVVEAGGGVELHNLVVFHRQIVPCAL